MKKIKYWLLLFILIPCFLISGCAFLSTQKYVTNISVGETIGSTTTYIVTYSDGSTSYFSVENGEDGENGSDLTVQAIKDYCEENNINFEDFLEQYLSVNYNPIQVATSKALLSTVNIYTTSPYSNSSNYQALSAGAGVIYKMNVNDSYVITNYHVVASETSLTGIASEIKLFQYGSTISMQGNEPHLTVGGNSYYSSYTFNSSAVTAEYVGGAEEYDLAVLKVKTDDLLANNENACEVNIAETYNIGETAIAVGNPNGDGSSVTSGIVSVESEYIKFDDSSTQYRVMRIDAAVNGGNSGGGLFNINGELIGIVNAKIEDLSIDNIAYALPYDNITKVADNLIHYYELTTETSTVKKLFLNISYSTENGKAVYNSTTNTIELYDEPIVQSVTTGGVGDIIGIKKGYTLISLKINNNNNTIKRAYQLSELLLTVRAGDKIEIGYKDSNGETATTNEFIVQPTHLKTASEMN